MLCLLTVILSSQITKIRTSKLQNKSLLIKKATQTFTYTVTSTLLQITNVFKTVICFNEHVKQLEFNQFISHVYVTE